MKRKLLKQMLNEWKANIWLILELVIVVIILEFTFSALYTYYSIHEYTSGNKLENIYVADIGVLDEKCEGYAPYDSVHSYATDLDMLLTKMRSNPYAEIVAAAGYNALPYNYNLNASAYFFRTPDGKKSEKMFYGNNRGMSPEIIEVLGIKGVNGESPRQLADMMRKGQYLFADAEIKDDHVADAKDFIGKETVSNSDTLLTLHVGAVVKVLRRCDYEPANFGTVYVPIEPEDARSIVVKVKPGAGNRFIESVSETEQGAGNLYLSQFTSIDDMRDSAQLEVDQSIRNFVICALFLLLVIFLGFLGTFWFRTQQRVSEIAIRKVNGATDGNIYARFFSEGLILLAVAVIISLPITYWIIKSEAPMSLNAQYAYIGNSAIWIGGTIAVVSLALLIILGIFAPTRRAARINPAEAIKDV